MSMTLSGGITAMKPNRTLIFLLAAILSPITFAGNTKPVVSKSPMDADQLSVYQAFLDSYDNGSKARLNLSKVTSALDLAQNKNDPCLKDIEFDPKSQFASVVHEFDSQTPLRGNFRLVNPKEQSRSIQRNDPGRAIRQGNDVNGAVEAGFAAGLLTLSEVAFDRHHRYAAMNFSFVCGGLCGHGSTIVFEKKDGKWIESNRRCSSWIS